jgi:hypothetical protein
MYVGSFGNVASRISRSDFASSMVKLNSCAPTSRMIFFTFAIFVVLSCLIKFPALPALDDPVKQDRRQDDEQEEEFHGVTL